MKSSVVRAISDNAAANNAVQTAPTTTATTTPPAAERPVLSTAEILAQALQGMIAGASQSNRQVIDLLKTG